MFSPRTISDIFYLQSPLHHFLCKQSSLLLTGENRNHWNASPAQSILPCTKKHLLCLWTPSLPSPTKAFCAHMHSSDPDVKGPNVFSWEMVFRSHSRDTGGAHCYWNVIVSKSFQWTTLEKIYLLNNCLFILILPVQVSKFLLLHIDFAS